jgi:hypothetical protein
MSELLRQERSKRMSYPIGSQDGHLKKLAKKLAEIRGPADGLSQAAKPVKKDAPSKKRSITERLAEADTEAKAYNSQRAQTSASKAISKNNKKEIE